MKKVYFHTFGCKVNQYETQVLRDRLCGSDCETVKTAEEADTIIINSCTVTGEADRQCRQLIRQLSSRNPSAKIIVTGCYAVRAPEEIRQSAPNVEVHSDKKEIAGGQDLSAITGFEGHSRAFVKIQDGCDAFCAYCIVPYVRSAMWSRPADEVIAEIRRLVADGYPEIVLSGVRLGRFEGGLPALLRKIVALEGNFRVRLSSLEIKEVSGELVDLMVAFPEKICPHLHLALQSGTDSVLRRMNRPYTAAEFRAIIDGLYARIPDISVSTDVIVGFPGETDKDFEDTCRFIEELRFSRLHVFKYSVRSGTKAASFPDHVPAAVIGARSKALREIDEKLQERYWRRFVGASRPAVVEGTRTTLLTDNYLRLEGEAVGAQPVRGIVSVEVFERDGRPWGRLK